MPLKRRNATVELADGRILQVRITNPDSFRYEETAQRRGWPMMTIQDGVATLADITRKSTFEAWAALKRTGQYTADWETFLKTDCVDVDVEEEPVDVDPTHPAPPTTSQPPSPGDSKGSATATSSEPKTNS